MPLQPLQLRVAVAVAQLDVPVPSLPVVAVQGI